VNHPDGLLPSVRERVYAPSVGEAQPLRGRPPTFWYSNVDLSRKFLLFNVIQETDTPSWIDATPKDWGSPGSGTPKADEWGSMATIYLPIALISAWDGKEEDEEGRHRRQLLDLTMCIVQATWLACRRRTDEATRLAYITCLCTYTTSNLQSRVQNSCLTIT
jgi:hypothetical protein